MNTIESSNNKLYLLKAGQSYKIGITSVSVKNRVKQLSTGNPNTIEIVKYIKYLTKNQAIFYENKLHKLFENKRLNGEWFILSDTEINKCIEFMTLLEPTRKDFNKTLKLVDIKPKQEQQNMSNQNQQLEPQSSNGWQNIGIMFDYAKRIPYKYRTTFMFICRESFGYCQLKTQHKPNEFWIDLIGISKPTFQSHIKYLSENKHLNIIHKKGYIQGGGSNAFAYSPSFPTGIAAICIKDIKQNIKPKEQLLIEQKKADKERISKDF